MLSSGITVITLGRNNLKVSGSVKSHLDRALNTQEMVLWTCLWTIILIRLTVMERPMLIVCRTSTTDMGSWLYKRRERVSCVLTCNDSFFSPHCRQDMTYCFEHLVPGLPHHDGLSSRTANKRITFYLFGGRRDSAYFLRKRK